MTTHRWRNWYWKLGLASSLAIGGTIFAFQNHVFAQSSITPDNTLGAEKSVVIPNFNSLPVELIDGGAQRGPNLFHSFQQFNVSEGREAYFTNPAGIQNILSRVTGNDPSDILGTLGVTGGDANLFLMNPNGIIFGKNASLYVGGSFLATTANAIQFASQGLFSASADVPSVLTVNPSAFLFNQIAAKPITSQAGLQVPEGEGLLLLGGDVDLDGGVLQAPGGRVELGGLAGAGTVGLNIDDNNSSLSFPNGVARADVSLTNLAFVNVAAGGGGSIAINARNIDISGDSLVRGGLETNLGFLGAQAGDILLRATGAINVVGTGGIVNNVRIGAVGKSGNIDITAGSLSVANGAQVGSATFGQGNPGNVTINAHDTVSFDGVGSDGVSSGALSSVEVEAVGNGREINITTGSLSVTNGAELLAYTAGKGDAGSVTINARDAVFFDGVGSNGFSSGTFSTVDPGAVGNGGSINITAKSLSVTNGAQLQVVTRGKGDAGSVTINARDAVFFDGEGSNGFSSGTFSIVSREGEGNGGGINITAKSLSMTNGALLDASTLGRGAAGNIQVNAAEAVQLIGTTRDGQFGSGLTTETLGAGVAGNLIIDTGKLTVRDGAVVSARTYGERQGGTLTVTADAVELIGTTSDGQFSSALSTETSGAGAAGNLKIKAGQLTVRDGAVVIVGSVGSGRAGNLEVTALSISLDNQGKLIAESASGQGGNITLQNEDLLLLRRNSAISATAGTAGAGGDGGNITIGTDLLVALEDSNITANAFQGRGGKVQINTQGDFRSLDSDITASSALGPQFSGTVEINTPDIELQNSLTQLTANFVSPEQVVAGSCLARRNVEQGSFVVTGTGGLPRSPYEAISGRYSVTGVQPIQGNSTVSSRVATVTKSTSWKRGDPIQEAQGMVTTADGHTIVSTTPQLVALAKAQNLVC